MVDPHIVALGGGTGLATLLRGLKHHTANLTAIVTIADDGGSSGRLRADLGMPPPGDARNCLVALSQDESLMAELFDHRFKGGSSLNGHSVGNLLLAALSDMRGGFRQGLEAAAQLLAVSGRVMPVSDHNDLTLWGETLAGQVIRGESAISHTPGGLRRVWMEPHDTWASETALRAIQEAELIVIGPGSLYTSIIPNFLLNGLGWATNRSKAPTVFVCNIATQPHETDGYGLKDHLEVFWGSTAVVVNYVVINDNRLALPEGSDQELVEPMVGMERYSEHLIYADVVDPAFPTRHDPEKLATAIMRIAALDPARF